MQNHVKLEPRCQVSRPCLLALAEPPLPSARGDGYRGTDPGGSSLFCWARQHGGGGLGTRQALMDKEDLAAGVSYVAVGRPA